MACPNVGCDGTAPHMSTLKMRKRWIQWGNAEHAHPSPWLAQTLAAIGYYTCHICKLPIA
eukprot:1161173-Pelagomonas_calceolata.AAC.3